MLDLFLKYDIDIISMVLYLILKFYLIDSEKNINYLEMKKLIISEILN